MSDAGDDAAEDGTGGETVDGDGGDIRTESIEPEEAFDVLGNETRIDILLALADRPGEAVPFSALRRAVGMTDSGQFNYHLDKLLGRFVRKTDDGYELTTGGMLVHGAILSGAYTESASLEPIALTGEGDACPNCRADLQIRYEDERLMLDCPDCGRFVATIPLAPGGLEGRARAEIPDAFDGYLRAVGERVQAGFCLYCSGPLEGHMELTSFEAFDLEEPGPVAVYECERCGHALQASPGALLVDHPAVVAFYYDHGRDVREMPVWRLPLLFWEAVTVTGEDPLTVAVEVELDGDRLTLTVDEGLAVVDVERTDE